MFYAFFMTFHAHNHNCFDSSDIASMFYTFFMTDLMYIDTAIKANIIYNYVHEICHEQSVKH